MVGIIIFTTIILLLGGYMFWASKKGVIICNNIGQSIPLDYEVIKDHCIPLITLTSLHGDKYTFLVDSGSTWNFLHKDLILDFSLEERKDLGSGSYYGVEGNTKIVPTHELTFTYRNSTLKDKYLLGDFGSAFSKIERTIGKPLHGIVGVPFLRNHGMLLDLSRMIVWKKL